MEIENKEETKKNGREERRRKKRVRAQKRLESEVSLLLSLSLIHRTTCVSSVKWVLKYVCQVLVLLGQAGLYLGVILGHLILGQVVGHTGTFYTRSSFRSG